MDSQEKLTNTCEEPSEPNRLIVASVSLAERMSIKAIINCGVSHSLITEYLLNSIKKSKSVPLKFKEASFNSKLFCEINLHISRSVYLKIRLKNLKSHLKEKSRTHPIWQQILILPSSMKSNCMGGYHLLLGLDVMSRLQMSVVPDGIGYAAYSGGLMVGRQRYPHNRLAADRMMELCEESKLVKIEADKDSEGDSPEPEVITIED